MTVETKVAIELSARELRQAMLAVGETSQGAPSPYRNLHAKLWEKTREAEGNLDSEEEYNATEELLGIFREGISKVNGYNEATGAAYLTQTPRTIRLTDIEGVEWRIAYSSEIEEFTETPAKSRDEELTMFREDGVGFSVNRNWWTDEPSDDFPRSKHGSIYYISDPSTDKFNRTRGLHPGTKLGLDLAKTALGKLLANTQIPTGK